MKKSSTKGKRGAKVETPEEMIARFVAAVEGRLNKRETRKAWRDYSYVCATAFRGGRLWRADVVELFGPVLMMLAAEQLHFQEQERREGFTGRFIERIEAGETLPSLTYLCRLCEVLGPRGLAEADGRLLAGYLTADAQPVYRSGKGGGDAKK
jgi:hypothetical protein